MNSYGLTRENLLCVLPAALRLDESVAALADAVASALALRPEEIDRLRIYPDIGRLDETMLDILAYDFKVDWWDADLGLPEKRQMLRDSFAVHRTLGTRYAVETALSDAYPGATIKEWFEYGGTPYCFQITLPITGEVTRERQRRVLSKIWYYKNLRSHLEALLLEWEATAQAHLSIASERSVRLELWPRLINRMESRGGVQVAGPLEHHAQLTIYPYEEEAQHA